MGAVLQLVRPEAVEQLARGLPDFRPTGLPLSELGRWFREEFASPLAPSTRVNYERTLRIAIEGCHTPGFGKVLPLPEHPSPADVTRWLSDMKVGGYGDATINLRRTDLVHVYEAGNRCAKTHGNPAMVLPWRKTPSKRAPLRDVAGTWAFLRSSSLTPRELAFVACLRFLGVRKGEALGLEWRHVDFKGRRVHVDQQRRKANSRATTRRLKSEAARRWIPMRAELVDVLTALRAEGETHEIRCGLGGGKIETTGLLFPFTEYQLAAILKVLRGIDPEGFPKDDAWHVFRHTVAVELWRAGKSEAFIQEWLGHASLEKTAVYLRSLDGRRISPAEVDAMDPDYRPKKPKKPRAKKNESPALIAPERSLVPETAVVAAAPVVPPVAPKEPEMKTNRDGKSAANPTTNNLFSDHATERGTSHAGGTSDPTPAFVQCRAIVPPAFGDMQRRAIVLFAQEIALKADELSRTDVESASAVARLVDQLVGVCEGRAGANAVSAGDLRSVVKEKHAAITALENMTKSYRLASEESESWRTLAETRAAEIEGLKVERDVVRLVLSPMPPQTVVERAEELVCQVRGVRSLVRRYEEEEAARVKSIDGAADQDTAAEGAGDFGADSSEDFDPGIYEGTGAGVPS